MPDRNHEALISGPAGDHAWNEWREKNPGEKPDLSDVNLSGHAIGGVNFSHTDLSRADLTSTYLTHCDLSGANLTEVAAAHTRWDHARISSATVLDRRRFAPDHPSLDDGTDTLVLPARDKLLNWGRIRWLGALPLFGASYIGLSAAIVVILGVDRLNESRYVSSLVYPVPTPVRIELLFWSSLFLAIGSTMYRVVCPSRVQEASETQWVEIHGRARLQYLAESFKRRGWQWPTAAALVIGAGLAIGLLVDRVIAVLGTLV